jgi:thioredoxin-dependent peroxiredoxin
MRLSAGQAAPDFEVTDISTGKPITLSDFRGHKLLMSFHRYAACPFCNLHVHELSKRFEEFEEQGLKVLALFRSGPERTLEQYGARQVPFQIAADPKLSAYRAYGIEQSLLGMLVSFIHPRGLYATLKGFLPGKVDAEVRSLPADFLITPDQRIARAYYSSNITQHLSLSEISEFARKAG